MTALGIGTFSVKDALFSPVIALFATACSYYWLRTNLGSKFWQESWEVEVAELSKELGVRAFERPLSEVRDQVERSLVTGQASEKRSPIRKWVDRLTLRKYSVTYNMILLSLVSTVLWLFVAVALIIRGVAAWGLFRAKARLRSWSPPSPQFGLAATGTTLAGTGAAGTACTGTAAGAAAAIVRSSSRNALTPAPTGILALVPVMKKPAGITVTVY